jgi:LmbE family N-acetylglucosaminyl deacetylase
MNVLVVAPHSDDECLGPGGTVALLAQAGAEVAVVTVCSEMPPLFGSDVRERAHAEARRAHAVLGVKHSIFLDVPTVEVTQNPVATLNKMIQEVCDDLGPKIAFVPFPDRHVDHRAVFDAAMVATRPYRRGTNVELVAMYETISETYWNAPGAEPTFAPQWTVDISSTIETKLRAFDEFSTRHVRFPGPRSCEALRALALFRGSQTSCAYGEAFQLARASFSPLGLFNLC